MSELDEPTKQVEEVKPSELDETPDQIANQSHWPVIDPQFRKKSWLNMTQLAEAVGTTRDTLIKWKDRSSKFPRYFVGKEILFCPIEIGVFLANNGKCLPEKEYPKKYYDPDLQNSNPLKNKLHVPRIKTSPEDIDKFDKEYGLLGSTSTDPEIVMQKRRVVKTAADIAELEYAQKKSLLIDRAKMEEDEATRYSIFCERWNRLPTELAARLEGMPLEQIEKIIADTVKENLDNLNKFIMSIPLEEIPEKVIEESDK